MTCADARHRILIADPSALRGETDRLLRTHLERCPTCSLVAARVIGDTERLGAALAARAGELAIRRPRRRRSAFVLAPIGVAAAMTLMVVSHRIARTGLAPSTRTAVSKRPATLTTSRSGGDAEAVSPGRDTIKQIASRVAAPTRAQRAAVRAEREIVPGTTTSDVVVDQEMPEIGITVGDNQRAAIIATSNPKITVVWLSRGQQP